MRDLNHRPNPVHYLIDTEGLLRDMEENRVRERKKRRDERARQGDT